MIKPTEQEQIARAAHHFLTDPALAPLLGWWRATSLHAVMPPGAVDPLRLAMSQGDRERLLAIYSLANGYVKKDS